MCSGVKGHTNKSTIVKNDENSIPQNYVNNLSQKTLRARRTTKYCKMQEPELSCKKRNNICQALYDYFSPLKLCSGDLVVFHARIYLYNMFYN